MKVFLIIFLAVSNFGFSQTKLDLTKQAEVLTQKLKKDSDDELQYQLEYSKFRDSLELKNQEKMCDFFGVSQIENIDSEFVFRFWDTSNLIEIARKNGNLIGKVIYAVKSTENGERFFRKTFILSKENTEAIYKLFNEKYDYLEELNWEKGSDGRSYIYESKKWNIYRLNFYNTCCNNPNEAKNYLEINANLQSILKDKKYFEIFDKEIPFRSYRYYGVAYSVVKFKK